MMLTARLARRTAAVLSVNWTVSSSWMLFQKGISTMEHVLLKCINTEHQMQWSFLFPNVA